jgi:curved DNA-binding protein CbpA
MTDPHRDRFYRRLDLGPEASRDEIVRAYRRLAHGAHPDAHPGDPDAARRFREIAEAYEGLTDPSQSASDDRPRAGRPIRVVVRPAGRGSSEEPWLVHDASNAGPTVFLGATRHLTADVPLQAGPVRVELPSQRAFISTGEPDPVLDELIARILNAWGRP